jgi:plastocyanin
MGATAGASDLRGSLTGAESLTPAPRPDPPRYRGSYWDAPNGAVTITAPRANLERDVAVVLTGPGVAEASQPVTVVVEGNRCRPGTVVVSPGTTVTFDNRDLLGHALYAVARGGDGPRVVEAELTSARTRRQVAFAQAGVFELRDERAPSFRCWVVVGPGQGRVLPVNGQGAFSTTSLGDGEYTVQAWYEGAARGSATATVAGRDAAPVQLSLQAGAASAAAAPAAAAPAAAAPAAAAPAEDERRSGRRSRRSR